MLWAVFRDGHPEKCDNEITDKMIEEYRKSGDVSYLIVAHSVINVFSDENLAQVCKSALQKDYPNHKYIVVQLHMVASTLEWS